MVSKVIPGKSYPLGATWVGEGINFAIYSEAATKVELCLFDNSPVRVKITIERDLLDNKMILDGWLEIKATDIFAIDGVEVGPEDGFEDCYQGTRRTPIRFRGKIWGETGIFIGALSDLLKTELCLSDNTPVRARITIEREVSDGKGKESTSIEEGDVICL